MRALLLGDSHLANLDVPHIAGLEKILEGTIENAAVGGSWSGDLRKQIGARDLAMFDVLMLSAGTNDTHPVYAGSPSALRRNLSEILAEGPRSVLLLSPGVRVAPAPFETTQLNERIRSSVSVAADTVTAHGGALVPTRWVLDELGAAAWSKDQVHLSSAAYDLLLPSLASAMRGHPGAMQLLADRCAESSTSIGESEWS